MPKFSDNWVVDRTMFEFVNGGSCACCSFPNLYPDGVAGMINAISDLETDAAQAEIKAAERSPWPPDMREQVWSDRVRLRHKLKKEMRAYQSFWEDEGEQFQDWIRNDLQPKQLRKMLQIPRSEVTERLKGKYNIHSAFGTVLCAVIEQVAHFKDTKYPVDARGDTEVAFEQNLVFDRRGGFTMRISDKDGNYKENVLQIWFDRMKSLGGPKLLGRAKKTSDTDDDEEGGADDAAQDDDGGAGPSFRSDRRIIRLLIARYWADSLMQKYKIEKQTEWVRNNFELCAGVTQE